MRLSDKQLQALDYLTDDLTSNLGYGGAAYGGKSVLGCYWLTLMCSELVGSKWFIGRDRLKDTRESVLFTFKKVSKMLGFKNWKYSENHIYFNNGSEIEFLDLSFMPGADPLYERFGSKEYTGGWIEEAGNVHPMAYEILKTRVGRWYNEQYGLIGKMLVTFNPKKNWVDYTFYRPWKTEQQEEDTKFIYALPSDNPDPDPAYLLKLQNIKDKATKERLLFGNFDYDDDPSSLLSYEDICNIWTNNHVIRDTTKRYLVCDVARYGSDTAVITIWYGWVLQEYHEFPISATTQIQQCINAMRTKHSISATNAIADEDGIGGGVVDNCRILGFMNGGKPGDKAYRALKDHCGYLLAEYIKGIYIGCVVPDKTKERIEEELGQLKTYETDKDGKLRILPKVKIKENIGRSPDWLDILIMRMYFVIFKSAITNRSYTQAVKLLG